MNILILSCGSRNKIVQYFRTAFQPGMVVCADSSPYAPALYEGDIQEIIPRINDPAYLSTILDLCAKHNVRGLVSLIDPELEIIARNKQKFEELGVVPMISSLEAVLNCFNKAEFVNTLRVIDIDSPVTTGDFELLEEMLERGEISFPLMVKPACGSASIGLSRVENLDECRTLFSCHEDLIAQEWINMDEYGVDCYVDIASGCLSSMFIKKKLLMKAGETDKSISRKNVTIRDTVIRFFERYPFRFAGAIDLDIFFDGERCLLSEVNPRFGGGYPHAYGCGIDFPSMYRNNLRGSQNPPFNDLHYDENIVMMKYAEIILR